MRAPAWRRVTVSGGEVAVLMRERILRAARECLERWGLEKTSMGDIAAQAGLSRRTLYLHFESRQALLTALAVQLGNQFGERLLAHIAGLNRASDRVVEYALYAIREFDREPLLREVTAAIAESTQVFSFPESRHTYGEILRAILGDQEIEDVDAGYEVLIRFIHSMIFVTGPVERDDEALRHFLRRHLVPALGVPASA